MPLISICIPTYNGQEYLKQCLDSCINQSFANYEIIICDDGSSDSTVSIIEEYAKRYKHIQFYKNQTNLGLVGNWNKCIEQSRGEWIKFVFQDDYITTDCLQVFANEIKENVHLIVSKRHFILPENPSPEYINYYTNEVRTLENTVNIAKKTFSGKEISEIAVQNICMNFIAEPSLTCFRKTVVNKLGYFNSALKQICDLEFNLRLASSKGLVYIPEQICAFRIHQNSTTSKNLTEKAFVLSYIEPLLFSYFLLFDKKFQSLRNNLNPLQTLKLKLYFRFKAYKAFKINQSEGYNHEVFSDSSKYNEILKVKKGSLLIWLIAVFK